MKFELLVLIKEIGILQSHPRLTEVDIKIAHEEIVSSKKEIENNLGQPFI